MKNYNQYNESLRDKMTPVSEEQIKMKMGDEKYPIYKAYNDMMNSLSSDFEIREPFDMNTFHIRGYGVKVRFWWVYFTISYNDNGWICYCKQGDNEDKIESDDWIDVYEKMKKFIKGSFSFESGKIKKEIKRHQNKLDEMEKSLTNFNENI